MQLQALRREASSKLMLLTTISMLLPLISFPVYFWFFYDSAMLSFPAGAIAGADMTTMSGIVIKVISMILVLPMIAFLALPIVSMFLIYKNARSGRPMKCVGFSLLRGYTIFTLVCEAFLLFLNALELAETYPGYSLSIAGGTFESLLRLLISIVSLSALNTARAVILYGGTERKISLLLPVLLILSSLLSAVQLVLIVLANTVPSMVEKLEDYRIATAGAFYAQIVYAALTLLNSFMFILLCFRGIKALSQEPGSPFVDTEAETP